MSRDDKWILLLIGLGILIMLLCCSGVGEETGLY